MSSLVVAIFLLSIGASFVQRTTGFGFGIFIMTMLPFFMPTYGEATTYFLIGNVMMTFVRAYNGFLTATVLTDYCFGLGGVMIGTALGAFVFKHIPNRIFRYVVYAYIAVSGVIILLSSCHS